MISSLYKIVSKILADRMKTTMRVVQLNQYSLTEGWNILDSILMVNECLAEYTSEKYPRVMVKLDLEKAYNKVSWEFRDFAVAI